MEEHDDQDVRSQGTKTMLDEIQRFVKQSQALDSMDYQPGQTYQESFRSRKTESEASSINSKLAKFLNSHSTAQ